MKTNARVLSILMIASMIIGFASILPAYAQGGVIYVDPANSIFPPPEGFGVGSTFVVNVTVANVTGLAGLSFDFAWDPTVLKIVTGGMTEVLFHAITPSDFYSNIWNLGLKFNNTAGTASYAQTWQDTGAAVTDGYAPANITSPIAAASFVFQVLKAAPTHGNVNSTLTISNVKAGDLNAQAIPLTIKNGYFELDWIPAPTTKPYFTVIPSTYTATAVGEEFNITVCVNNLAEASSAVGFEFKLRYNSTILELVSVTEGPWLKPFGAAPNQGTLFLTSLGSDFVQVGDVILPDANGTWHAFATAPNPNTVPMAILTFKAKVLGEFPNVLSSNLTLYDTKVGDYLGIPVVQGESKNGFYQTSPKPVGRVIDVFVGQDGIPYPYPYGGQGPNAPADLFWPQKEVCVWANVTYNEWPEQQKDVAFEIFDPSGARWGIIYARTNETGTAFTCFRLPWPCDNPEQYIGVWTVVSSVDIACVIVNDTVRFHYDYLVRIWKVTADKASYKHNETACYTIEYGSHAQQTYNVTIVLTGLDESGVPFGFAYKQVQIGGTVFCQYKNYTDTLCIYIPKWARAGTGEVDVAFLDNWPYSGGTVQSGYYTGTTWLGYYPIPIKIEAA